jgi:hypothetical protein
MGGRPRNQQELRRITISLPERAEEILRTHADNGLLGSTTAAVVRHAVLKFVENSIDEGRGALPARAQLRSAQKSPFGESRNRDGGRMSDEYRRVSVPLNKQELDHLGDIAEARGMKLDEALIDMLSKTRRSNSRGRRALSAASIQIRNKGEVLRYSRIIIAALEEALEYDPTRHHNLPSPNLRIEDPEYLVDIQSLVIELRRLNGLLVMRRLPLRETKKAGIHFSTHINKFFGSYATEFGKLSAKGSYLLLAGAVAGLLLNFGVPQRFIDEVWSHIKGLK